MNLQAITGQLFIVDGYAKDPSQTPGVWVQPPPKNAARGRSGDFLFIHLTLSGQPEETAVLSQDLIDAICRHYFATSGSITSALREAISNANQQLLRFNVTTSQTTREGAISCAVVRKDELYSLQVGEAFALIGRNFGIERLPAKVSEHITPLGRTSGLNIRYEHHRLQPGDSLLFLDPRISHLDLDNFQSALVDADIEESLILLQELVGHDSARLLLVSFMDEMPTKLPDVAQPLIPSKSRQAIRPQPRREPRDLPVVPDDARQPQPILSATATLPTTISRTARQTTSKAILGLSKFTDELADSLDRFKPSEDVLEPIEEQEIGWPLLALISVIIPLIIGGVVSSVFIQRTEGRQLAVLKQEMATNMGLASQAASEEEQRLYYGQVLSLAQQISTELRPNDSDVNSYRQQAQNALDALDNISRLHASLLFEFPPEVNLTAVVLQPGDGGDLFVLDGNTGIVYQIRLDEQRQLADVTPAVVYSPGQAVGSHLVGPIVDIFWRPEGQAVRREGLAALDLNGALLSYRPNLDDTVVASLGFASEWQRPYGVSTYDERLYILDQGAEQIWRYFPVGDQFEIDAAERSLIFLEDPELDQVTDFDLFREDGSLVLLYGDGRIRYYNTRSLRLEWDENQIQEFDPNIAPLIKPAAVKFIGDSIATGVFVADPGSGRILWFNTRAGNVLDQFRATDENGQELFTRLSDFTVTPDFDQFFFVAENQVYLAER